MSNSIQGENKHETISEDLGTINKPHDTQEVLTPTPEQIQVAKDFLWDNLQQMSKDVLISIANYNTHNLHFNHLKFSGKVAIAFCGH